MFAELFSSALHTFNRSKKMNCNYHARLSLVDSHVFCCVCCEPAEFVCFFSGGSHEGVGRKKKLNSFVFCLSWLSCDPVSLARLSYSVRGVGNRPEPWADDLAEAMKALVGKNRHSNKTHQQN